MASAIKHFFGKSRKVDKSDDLNGSSVAHRRASSLRKTSRVKGAAVLRESSQQVEGALMWEDLISSPTAKGWKPTKSPYSVVTEPKAAKSAKSCPIGAYSHYDPRTASDHSSSQSRPPSSIPPSAAYFGLPSARSRFPVIHESGECYENFSNMDFSRQRHNAEHISARGRNFRRNGGGSLIEYRRRGDRLWLDHYPLSSELNASRNISNKSSSHRGGRNAATSEYGSADPSPTDLLYCRRLDVLRPLENGGRNAPASEGNSNSDDYDSCDSDELPSDLIQLCTQQLKRANGKCKLYKQVAKRYRAKNTKLVEELGELSEALSNEKRKNYALLHRLSQVERELEDVRCYRVPPAITQPPGDFSLGAGEALCLREDDSNGIFDPYPYDQSNNPPTQLNYSQSPSLFDELKHYRRAEEECSDSLSEFSRHKSPGTAESSNVVTSPYKLSPLRGQASDDPKAALAENNAVIHVEHRLLTTRSRRGEGMIPKGLSLSDSALNNLCATENGEQEVPIIQSTAHSNSFNSSARNVRPTRIEGCGQKSHHTPARRKYHSFKAPQRADYYSSYSSDDDQAIRLMARQLRCRGEVVHFRPPRKCVEQRHFSHFGPPERQAIAQFEYLLDMSTDVSGLMSSPDPTPK